MMEKLTKEQAIAIMGFTGISTTNFSTFHKDVEQRMGCPVFTHQFANEDFMEKIKELYREDFLKMCMSYED